MSKRILVAILVVIMVVGLGVMLYPTVSDMINKAGQSKIIGGYDEEIGVLTEEQKNAALSAASDYNSSILSSYQNFKLSGDEKKKYNSLLNLTGDGVMGYIDIPKIKVSLAIYHGTEEEVLVKGVGHIEGSSLPVGGKSTHCVLSGHRGLPRAKLFTDLDKMEVGDRFELTVLGKKLVYEVFDILVVLPDETEPLRIVEGEDMCTLVTCTPYGINTHRLFVRAKRVAE